MGGEILYIDGLKFEGIVPSMRLLAVLGGESSIEALLVTSRAASYTSQKLRRISHFLIWVLTLLLTPQTAKQVGLNTHMPFDIAIGWWSKEGKVG